MNKEKIYIGFWVFTGIVGVFLILLSFSQMVIEIIIEDNFLWIGIFFIPLAIGLLLFNIAKIHLDNIEKFVIGEKEG